MTIGVEHETPRAGVRDAVTFSFGDAATGLFGLARIDAGGDGVARGLAVVYAGGDVAGATHGSAPVAGDGGGGEPVAGIVATVQRPLEAWTLRYDGEHAGLDLRFEARSHPAAIPAQATGGMEGYEQLCSVSGSVTHGGRTEQVSCRGQRGHAWGEIDLQDVALVRSLSAWLGTDRAIALAAVRPAKARGHDEEVVAAWLIEDGDPVAIAEPRLSTTYDGEQHQRRAGLELWVAEDSDYARRAGGEVVCGTTIELGDARLESAFLRWRMEGRQGVGRYDILRPVGVGNGDGDGRGRRKR